MLLIPSSQAERASMTLFTGAAILEEKFVTGYFRFNDDTFAELQPALRPAEDAQEYLTQWDSAARNLAQLDALRLLLTFSNALPTSGPEGAGPAKSKMPADDDRMLHARLQGRTLGTFDLYFDSLAAEQIWAGQQKSIGGESFYDVWSAFALGQPGGRSGDAAGAMGEEAKPEAVNVSQYRIQAHVAPPTRLDAEAFVQLEVRQGGQRAVLFELSRFLQISKVEANGRPLEFIHNQALEGTQLARRGNDLVAVIFPQPLRAGEQIGLHFVYGGEVLSEAGAGLLYVGARGTWYPNRGLEMARFDLQFRYPAGWTLLATGKRIEGGPADLPPGEQSSHWVSDRPMPIAGFNLGKYTRVEAPGGQDGGRSLRRLGRGARIPARYDPGAGFASTPCALPANSPDRRGHIEHAVRRLPRAMRRRSQIRRRARSSSSLAALVPTPIPAWRSPKCPARSVKDGPRLSSSPAFPSSRRRKNRICI